MEVLQAPTEFVKHLLLKLDEPEDSIRFVRHLKPPVPSLSSVRYSFKTFDLQTFVDVLSEQDLLPLEISSKSVNGERANADEEEKSAEDLLAEAAQEAENLVGQPRSVVTNSEITVSECEGERFTREAEFIWFPNLYSSGLNTCKLVVRFFNGKLSM